jgi:predicted RNase H-like nuclease (RuvC/YqgF family)
LHAIGDNLMKEDNCMRDAGPWSGPRESGRLLVPLLALLTVASIAVAGVAIYVQFQERDRRQAKEEQLRLSQSENAELKSKLEESEDAKERAEQELVTARQELTRAEEELVQTIKKHESLSESVETREAEIARLTRELEQAQSESRQVVSQLNSIQSERDQVKKQLTQLEQAKHDLESKVIELAEQPTVELDKVLVTGDRPAGASGYMMPVSASSTAVDGQVVVINREYDFIVMNLGKTHGLSIGQEFRIVRGNEVLGRVKVEKVYDELSAAALLPDSKKSSIREGDAVQAL